MRREVPRQLNQQRHVRRIIESAVVQIVSGHGGSKAIAVEVRGNHDVLLCEIGTGAGQHGKHIRRCDVALQDVQPHAQSRGKLEVRQRLPATAELQNRYRIPAAILEHGLEGVGIDTQNDDG